MNYFDRNPIQNKALAADCQEMFCSSYELQIRLQCALNRDGKQIHHTVFINDFKGHPHANRIILN